MEIKKTKHAAIEHRRSTWLLMGFIIVLALMFVTFEWAQYDKHIDTSAAVKELTFSMDLEPIILPEKPSPPPLPDKIQTDEFVIVDDDSETPESTLAGTENEGDAVIAVYIPPAIEEDMPFETEIVDWAEVMPMYPGGQKALNGFLSKHMKYPTIPQEHGIEGRVIVQFIVDTDGAINQAKVVRGVHPQLDAEALRVINMMPKWAPGKQRGKAVRVKYTLPVAFKLQ